MRILALEPYYGGSHRAFLDGLVARIDAEWSVFTLPARAWKWRLRTAAPHFADEIKALPNRSFDLILASSMLDLPTFCTLSGLEHTPSLLYFHENQFAYPAQHDEPRDLHLALTNVLSAAAADTVAFNSIYNRETFMDGARELLRRSPDTQLSWMLKRIESRSLILPVPIDLMDVGPSWAPRPHDLPPIVLWNHRWEHDKNPAEFFDVLFQLHDEGVPFRLALLGQSFPESEGLFDAAASRLGKSRVVQMGAIENRSEYLSFLGQCQVVVSTAHHEFQGLSVLEAVSRGVHPLLPRRLSYPELFPPEVLYNTRVQLLDGLRARLVHCTDPNKSLVKKASSYLWGHRLQGFEDVLNQTSKNCR